MDTAEAFNNLILDLAEGSKLKSFIEVTSEETIFKDEYQYLCNKCPFKSKRKDGLQIHRDATHEKIRYHCTTCDKEYGYKQQLKLHIDTAHKEITYPCNKQ